LPVEPIRGSTSVLASPFLTPSDPTRHLSSAAQPSKPLWSRAELGQYRLRLAANDADRIAACRLRFEVFNLELGEGLASSYSSGLDQDHFDQVCDHLLIEDMRDSSIVGTYRMQSGSVAERHYGYYSEREFDFTPYDEIRPMVLEVGRASIAMEHRSSEVLTLLWRGLTQYAQNNGLRYMLGCSSLNTNDPDTGWAIYNQLSTFLARPDFRTVPTRAFKCPLPGSEELPAARVPKLLKTYLAVGSRICGEPALDNEFGTVDFLTLLDLEEMSPAAKSRFCHTQ
jgi:putative hemolysin